jgi:pimeloyl-ACP methyl ester carboxylesterase
MPPTKPARVLLAVLLTFVLVAAFSVSLYGVARAGGIGEDLPDVGLEGVNDPDCEPEGEDRERPVVLLHGTFGTAAEHFSVLAPLLQAEGWCVYALDYGNQGTAPVGASAKELAAFVDQVLEVTEADRVDIVGYSQGGMMPRQYLRFEGGAPKVQGLVGIAPSNHGTGGGILVNGQADPDATDGGPGIADCLACLDQLANSAFLRTLNQGGDILTGPDGAHLLYTTIATRHDLVVFPYTSQALQGPPGRVTNLVLQEKCPGNRAGHLSIRDDPVALQLVLNALEHDGLADPAFQPVC